MSRIITKTEIKEIIVKLTQWLDWQSPFHFMYNVANNELSAYQAQLALMEEQNETKWENKVPTEFYKQLEWKDATKKRMFC